MTRYTVRPASSQHDRAMAYEPRAGLSRVEVSKTWHLVFLVPTLASQRASLEQDPYVTHAVNRTACNSYSRNVALVNRSPGTSEIHLTAVSL